jgi:hypothetical protein
VQPELLYVEFAFYDYDNNYEVIPHNIPANTQNVMQIQYGVPNGPHLVQVGKNGQMINDVPGAGIGGFADMCGDGSNVIRLCGHPGIDPPAYMGLRNNSTLSLIPLAASSALTVIRGNMSTLMHSTNPPTYLDDYAFYGLFTQFYNNIRFEATLPALPIGPHSYERMFSLTGLENIPSFCTPEWFAARPPQAFMFSPWATWAPTGWK